MNNDPVIVLDNIRKTFWIQDRTDATILSRIADAFSSGTRRHYAYEIVAVRDASLSASQGEVLGIVGNNAAGKTTLLRLIAGILQPDSGKVYTRGRITSLINLSVEMQKRLSVHDNIFFSCAMFGMSHKDIKDVYSSILTFADLRPYTDLYPYQLSDGMRQRLSFSIAVHTSPDILLLDEVFSAGDFHFKKKAEQKMKDLIRSDITVVMVTHDRKHIETFCNRAFWLDRGSIVVEGDPHDVCRAYYREAGIPV